jgi:hypothetical protein
MGEISNKEPKEVIRFASLQRAINVEKRIDKGKRVGDFRRGYIICSSSKICI